MIILNKLRVPKAVISAFILMYVLVLVVWLQPNQRWRNNVLQPVRPIIMFSGLWQNFEVFAPDPRKVNIHLDAEVTFADNTRTIWEYPRMDKLDYLERMVKERYRKLGMDYANWDENKKIWPDLARYIARQEAASRGRVPIQVVLRRHFTFIPPPDIGLIGADHEPERSAEFFKYVVQPGDLK